MPSCYENPISEYQIKCETKDSKKLKDYWGTGIGLNQVDNLKPSEYLIELAEKHIDGLLTSQEVEGQLREYYKTQDLSDKHVKHTYECDIVSKRIVDLLDNGGFIFSPQMLKNIHGYLFQDMPAYHPGDYRDCELKKSEPILNGNTVIYGSCLSIQNNLKYDFEEEKGYRYQYQMTENDIRHLSNFISHIWQVHPFREGNTRTTAVFTELYLRNMGYDVNNQLFEKEAVYFRDALVRNNYTDVKHKVYETDEFLNIFFSNLINHARMELDHNGLDCRNLYD